MFMKYPKYLLKQWEKFKKDVGSENDRPDQFPAEQKYIVFKFEEGG